MQNLENNGAHLLSGPTPKTLEAQALALKEAIQSASSLILAGEASPDADCCGAQIAMGRLARLLNPEISITYLNDLGCPERYLWLRGTKKLRRPGPKEASAELAIVVDGGIERCGEETIPVVGRCQKLAIIDHHIVGSKHEYDFELIDAGCASTTELIYRMASWWQLEIDRHTAEALYMGLAADTNSFQYSSTTAESLRIASELRKCGARAELICERVLLERPFSFTALQSRVYGRMARHLNERVLVAVVRDEDLKGLELSDPPYDLLLASLSFIKGVEVTLMLKCGSEAPEAPWRRLSLRSRGRVNVAELCRELDPQGGGHARAAGCRMSGTDDQIITTVLERLRALLGEKSVT